MKFVRPKFKTEILARNRILFTDTLCGKEYEMYYILDTNPEEVVYPILKIDNQFIHDKRSTDYALGLETKVKYLKSYRPAMLIDWFEKALIAILKEEFNQDEVDYEWRMTLYGTDS